MNDRKYENSINRCTLFPWESSEIRMILLEKNEIKTLPYNLIF